jgi:hypothetical protein
MARTVQLWLAESGADEARTDLLHRQLRAQLVEEPVLEVTELQPADVPNGARGVDAASVSTLAIAILGSGGLSALIASVRDWLGRGHAAPRTVRLEISGETLELTGATTGEQERLVDLFVARHEVRESP